MWQNIGKFKLFRLAYLSFNPFVYEITKGNADNAKKYDIVLFKGIISLN